MKKETQYTHENGVLICEDMWAHGDNTISKYETDPVLEMEKLKPDLLLNLSASPYYFEKKDIRKQIFSKVAKTLKCPQIMCNQVGANDQLVFDGHSMYFDKEGQLLAIAKGFVEDHMLIDLEKPMSIFAYIEDPIKDIYEDLVVGVKDYFRKLNLTKASIGLSGGID